MRQDGKSVGRYVDDLTIVVAGYSGLPQPRDLEELSIVSAPIGGTVDQEALVDELESAVAPNPFALQQRWSHFSWGADAAVLRIVLEISTAVGGIAGVVFLAEKITNAVRSYEPTAADIDRASRQAREQLSQLLRVSEEEVRVVEVKPRKGKVELSFETPVGSFSGVAEVEGLIHLRRTSAPSAEASPTRVDLEDDT